MPRRIIGGAFVSVDGVMQAPGGPTEDPTGGFAHGGWLAPLGDEGLNNQIGTLFNGSYDLLLGRRTYEIFAAHWPFMGEDDPIAAAFNRIRKYVVSGGDPDTSWTGTQLLRSLDDVAAVKAEDGPDLVIQGSSTLYPQLVERGLLDRLIVMTAPVLLGPGKRLFDGGLGGRTLKLVEHRVGSGGIACATYDLAGEVETGSYPVPEVSELEKERRRRMEEGKW